MVEDEVMMAAREQAYETFRRWLCTIDPNVTWEARPEVIETVLQYFSNNDVTGVSDCIGLSYPDDFSTPGLKGGKLAFLKKALQRANRSSAEAARPPMSEQPEALLAIQAAVSAGSDQALKAVGDMMKCHKATVHVNMAERLEVTRLDGMSSDLLPEGTITDWLATENQKELEKGIKKPFVVLEVKKCMPHWCCKPGAEEELSEDDHDPQVRATRQLAKAMGQAPKAKKELTIMQWLCGFKRAALAYHAVGMWEYTAALAHEDNCLQIAVAAELGGRRFWLAVIYDRLVRAKWRKLAYANAATFDINKASITIDEQVLGFAEKEFDSLKRQTEYARPGKGHSDRNYASDGHSKGGSKGYGRSDYKGKGYGKDRHARSGADRSDRKRDLEDADADRAGRGGEKKQRTGY